MMRLRLLAVAVAMVVLLAVPAVAGADPNGPNANQTVSVSCTDGSAFTVNTGPLPNVGRVAWVVDNTSVFVTSFLAFTDGTDTFVLFDSKQGLTDTITCSGDAGGGFTVISKGFWTPRH
jgi:hypothetical protein